MYITVIFNVCESRYCSMCLKYSAYNIHERVSYMIVHMVALSETMGSSYRDLVHASHDQVTSAVKEMILGPTQLCCTNKG